MKKFLLSLFAILALGIFVAGATTVTKVAPVVTVTCTATNYATSALAATGIFTCTGPFARLDVTDQSATGGANYTVVANSTGNLTIDCGLGLVQKITNGGAFTLTAPTSDGACILDVENNGSAGTVSYSGFSPTTPGGTPIDTTNAHNFRVYVSRVDGHSTADIKALQ
jgi:hypothetical protein